MFKKLLSIFSHKPTPIEDLEVEAMGMYTMEAERDS